MIAKSRVNLSDSLNLYIQNSKRKFYHAQVVLFLLFTCFISSTDCSSTTSQMNLIIMGKPGCGKGTQSKRLSQRYNIKHITSGNLLREAAEEESSTGEYLRNELLKGNLISYEIVNELVQLSVPSSGFILDGYPRKISQVTMFEQIDLVILIEISDDESMKRILSRNESRSDDNEAVVKKRLEDYKSEVGRILQYYRCKGILEVVDGHGTVDQVFDKIVEVIEKKTKKSNKLVFRTFIFLIELSFSTTLFIVDAKSKWKMIMKK